jgi:hypothetical protein
MSERVSLIKPGRVSHSKTVKLCSVHTHTHTWNDQNPRKVTPPIGSLSSSPTNNSSRIPRNEELKNRKRKSLRADSRLNEKDSREKKQKNIAPQFFIPSLPRGFRMQVYHLALLRVATGICAAGVGVTSSFLPAILIRQFFASVFTGSCFHVSSNFDLGYFILMCITMLV